jgi:hypothetical protein
MAILFPGGEAVYNTSSLSVHFMTEIVYETPHCQQYFIQSVSIGVVGVEVEDDAEDSLLA